MATALANPAKPDLYLKSSGFAAALLAVYLFMLYSRIFEASQLFGVPKLYLILVLSVIALLTVTFNGGLLKAAKTPAGVLLLMFTLWAVLILPFSSWKSESLRWFGGVWLKSLATFFIVAGLTRSFADVKRALVALGYGAAISVLIIAVTTRSYAERAISFGSFGNSNEMAFHIVLGLPFLILLVGKSNLFFKVPLAAVALLSVAETLKTASRGGLIMTAAVVVVSLLTVSIANKAKIAGIVLLAGMIGALTVNDTALERYKTIFGSTDSSDEARSARQSAEERKALLQMSIDLTLSHPLFGVGMGDFPPAAAEISASRGQRGAWQVTHNSYTQLSCETGFLGAFIILGVFVVCLYQLYQVGRAAKRLRLTEMRNMAISILLGFVILTVHFALDALAYDFYLPMLAGLCMAFVSSAKPLILEAEGNPAGPLSVPAISVPVRPPAPKPRTRPDDIPGPQGRNPYRLGGRRKDYH